MTSRLPRISRRTLVKAAVAGGAALAMPSLIGRAQAQGGTLTVGIPGGYGDAWDIAYFRPFAEETGIQVTGVVRRDHPVTEFKVQVDTGAYRWDVTGGITADTALQLAANGLCEPLDLDDPEIAKFPANAKTDTFLGYAIQPATLVYQKDAYPDGLPGWEALLDREAFPGRRALRRRANESIELALRLDGVAPSDIYTVLSSPEGWDRAFASLERIRPFVDNWWESDATLDQQMGAGEFDMALMYSQRAVMLIGSGAPLGISWKDGFYSMQGWCMPKGSPGKEVASQFIKFASNPQRMAEFTKIIPIGMLNPDVYQHLPEEIAVNLPTYPANFAQISEMNAAFWAENATIAAERFTEWVMAS